MTEQQTAAWLKERDNFLVLTHIRPDGDTLGCAAALCIALEQMGKTAYVLPNPGQTETYDGYLDFHWAPESFVPEYVVAVDIATEDLFPEGKQQEYKGKVDLCIDHHPSNTGFARELCLDGAAAACGEILYRICKLWGIMNEPIARSLYIAISTDCGGFIYSNTTPQTHRIAAELMELVEVKKINKHFFQTKTAKELSLQAKLMSSEVFFEDGKVCIGAITVADKASVNANEGDCEELSSFAATIEGVLCAATVRELAPGNCKISLRTDPEYVSANKICGYMGGGGHPAAAGASVPGTVEHAREVVYESIMKALKS